MKATSESTEYGKATSGPHAALQVKPESGEATTTVKQLGTTLMNAHIAGVLIVGVILTVALIGAVVLAANDRDYTKEDK